MKVKLTCLIFVCSAVTYFMFKGESVVTNDPQVSVPEKELSSSFVDESKAVAIQHSDNSEEKSVKIKVDSVNEVVRGLKEIERCSRSLDCYSQKDPKDYSFKIGKEITSQLRSLNHLVRSQKIKNKKITFIGRKYLSREGDNVKFEALKLLSSQGVDSSIINPIFEEVLSSPHPESTKLAVELLAQLKTPSEQKLINNKIYNLMTRGGVYPALEVVKNLDYLLSDDSRPYFEKALADIGNQRVSERLYTELKKKLEL